MAKYIVGYISFYDYDMKLKVIRATGWREALKIAFNFEPEGKDLQDAQQYAFDNDCMFEVIELGE